MDDLATSIVTPFGQFGMVQHGVLIQPLRSIKDRFMRVSDDSVYDLTPEECAHPLKRRLYGT